VILAASDWRFMFW